MLLCIAGAHFLGISRAVAVYRVYTRLAGCRKAELLGRTTKLDEGYARMKSCSRLRGAGDTAGA